MRDEVISVLSLEGRYHILSRVNNYFEFDEKFFRQKLGTAIGTGLLIYLWDI